MSKYFLVSRAFILAALIFILTAVAWGWIHDTKPAASGEADHLEKYAAKKPSGNTTLFFVISLSFGVVLVSFSIWLEWMRTHRGSVGAPPAEDRPLPAGVSRGPAAGEAAGNALFSEAAEELTSEASNRPAGWYPLEGGEKTPPSFRPTEHAGSEGGVRASSPEETDKPDELPLTDERGGL